MKICRYRYGNNDAVNYGVQIDDIIYRIEGSVFSEHFEITKECVDFPPHEFLAPTNPQKIFGVSENFGQPENCLRIIDQIFTKTINSVIACNNDILIPPDSKDLFFEGELVVIIGREARNISVKKASDFIFGYTCGNDVSENAWFLQDRQWWRVKGADTFAPVGPYIATEFNWREAKLITRVNGKIRQYVHLSDMRSTPEEVIAIISRYITLIPGDIIFMGTPPGAGTLYPDDVVEVEVSGIGILKNRVKRKT